MKKEIIDNTRSQLMACKEILTPLPPEYFIGAGLRFVSLVAKQVLFEGTNEGNQLGWMGMVEDVAWVIKHQREVSRFWQYCQCCKDMTDRGATIDIILHQCGAIEPDTLIGPAILFSEGLQKILSWLYQGQ